MMFSFNCDLLTLRFNIPFLKIVLTFSKYNPIAKSILAYQRDAYNLVLSNLVFFFAMLYKKSTLPLEITHSAFKIIYLLIESLRSYTVTFLDIFIK